MFAYQKLEEKKAKSCKSKMARYVIDPLNPYWVIYDMLISLMYQIAFFCDIYVISFKYEPLDRKNIRIYQ